MRRKALKQKKKLESSFFWNPESTELESRIHRVESRIQDCHGFPYMGRYHWYQWTIGIALYPARPHLKIIKVPLMKCTITNRTIAIGCFSIGTNRTIGTNRPLELPCTQLDHIRK